MAVWIPKTIAVRVENIIKSKLKDIVASLIKNQNTGDTGKNADQQILAAMISGGSTAPSLDFFRNGNKHDFDRVIGRYWLLCCPV